MMNPQDKLITQECFRRTKYGFPKNGQFFLPKKPAGLADTKKAIRGAGPRIAFGFEKQVERPGFGRQNLFPVGLGVLFDVSDSLADRCDFFSLLVGDCHIEFFFEFHDKLDGIEGVSTEVLDEIGTCDHLSLVNAQFVNDDFFDAFSYV